MRLPNITPDMKLTMLSKFACAYLEGHGMINVRQSSLRIFSLAPFHLSAQVTASRLWPQADTWPDTWADNQHHTSSAGLIYVSSQMGLRRLAV